VSFADFVARWRRDSLVPAQLNPSTLASYLSVIDRHLLPAFGSVSLSDISPSEVQRFVAEKMGEKSGIDRPSGTRFFFNV